jgi:alkyl sulfatase BDS1-like metallo-beta-lactamase superfamily hydrolase
VHSILRRYTGWYDGNPSHLFPSPSAEIAAEVLALADGAGAVLQRARTLLAKGERGAIQRALHLLDFVIEGGAAEGEEARSLKAEALEARAEHEDSFIARNILASAAVLEKSRGSGC